MLQSDDPPQTNGHGHCSREESQSPPVFYSHNGTPEHGACDTLPTHTQSHPTGINHDSGPARSLHLHAMGNSQPTASSATSHKGSHGNITITGPSGEGMQAGTLIIVAYYSFVFFTFLSRILNILTVAPLLYSLAIPLGNAAKKKLWFAQMKF